MQSEFMSLYEHYQDLINQCYPGSGIKLPIEVGDVLDIFSHI